MAILASKDPTPKINNRKDILLLLLYSPGVSDRINEPIIGRTRLVKMLFLFKKEAMQHFSKGTLISDENFYQFFPWNFGPFSSQVFDDLTFFLLRGFIEPTTSTDDESLPESAAEWERWLEESGTLNAFDSRFGHHVGTGCPIGSSLLRCRLGANPLIRSNQKTLLQRSYPTSRCA